jgi:hypothetical protein
LVYDAPLRRKELASPGPGYGKLDHLTGYAPGGKMARRGSQQKARKMVRLVVTMEEQFAESAELESAIRRNLRELGFGR